MARSIARFNPLAELDAWEKRFMEGFPMPWRGAKLPTTDMWTDEDAGQLVVEAHLPGFAAEDIEVSIDAGTLVIEAEHRESETSKKKNYIVRESSSSFYRRVDLPGDVKEAEVTAEFDQGVLTVKAPFKAESEPTRIQVSKGTATPATPIEPAPGEPAQS